MDSRERTNWHLRQAAHLGSTAVMHAVGAYPFGSDRSIRRSMTDDQRAAKAAEFARVAARHALDASGQNVCEF